MSDRLRETAQRLVDIIFAEAQAEPFILPLRTMRAANDLRSALAATPSGGPLDRLAERINDEADIRLPDGRLAIAREHVMELVREAATPSGGPLDVPKWLETLTTYHVFPNDKLNARETTVFQMTVGYIKRQYARLTEDAG